MAAVRGVKHVVVTRKADLAVTGDIDVIAAVRPQDIIPQRDVRRRAPDRYSVAGDLVHRVVDDLGSRRGDHDDSLLSVGVDEVVRHRTVERIVVVIGSLGSNANTVAVDVVGLDQRTLICVNTDSRIIVDPVTDDARRALNGVNSVRISEHHIVRGSAAFEHNAGTRRVVRDRAAGNEDAAVRNDPVPRIVVNPVAEPCREVRAPQRGQAVRVRDVDPVQSVVGRLGVNDRDRPGVSTSRFPPLRCFRTGRRRCFRSFPRRRDREPRTPVTVTPVSRVTDVPDSNSRPSWD